MNVKSTARIDHPPRREYEQALTRVRFEPAGVECEVYSPARLIDVTDEHPDADVPFSCRAANCGTCRVRVLEGAQAMAPPNGDEAEILAIFGDEAGVRLCCQLELIGDADKVVLEVVTD